MPGYGFHKIGRRQPVIAGTATGMTNFLNFTISAMMGQVFGWLLLKVSDSAEHMLIRDYRMTFGPLLFGVPLAIFMNFFFKETGHAVMKKR